MSLVSLPAVGAVAFERMLRDGVLLPVAGWHALPTDIPETPRDRAAALEHAVPGHTVLTGCAGLWARFGGSRPPVVDVVGRRGLHRFKPGTLSSGLRVAFHSGPAFQEPADAVAGIRIASPARCAADALRWGDLADAMPRVYGLVRGGEVDPRKVSRLVREANPRGAGAARERSAWAATWGASRR